MFTDEGIRSQLEMYDAVAVIDWDVVVLEESLQRLYSAAFEPSDKQPYWVKAADGRPLPVIEAEERHRELVETYEDKRNHLGDHPRQGLRWTVNGKAIICESRYYFSALFGIQSEKPATKITALTTTWFGDDNTAPLS